MTKLALITWLVVLGLGQVSRPLFPVKAAPPFRGEMIVIGDDFIQGSAKEAPVTTTFLITRQPDRCRRWTLSYTY
jgi:hypothetical protein